MISYLAPLVGLLALSPIVLAAPAAASSAPSAQTTLAKPLPFNSSFIYELDHDKVASPVITTKSGLKINNNVYIVDMQYTTAQQIAKYKADGKIPICYLSAGTWEPGRDDSADFDPSCFCGPGAKVGKNGCTTTVNKMEDWNEWWFDIHSAKCKANVLAGVTKRIQRAKDKGCMGVDPDNVDSYTNTDEQKHGNTAQDQVDYLVALAKSAHGLGMLIDLKNGGALLEEPKWQSSIVNSFDFSVIEECNHYKECNVYDPFLAAGKPQIQIEYSNSIKKCPTLKKGQNLLVYSGLTLDTSKITLSCRPK